MMVLSRRPHDTLLKLLFNVHALLNIAHLEDEMMIIPCINRVFIEKEESNKGFVSVGRHILVLTKLTANLFPTIINLLVRFHFDHNPMKAP